MVNALTRDVGISFGPIVLETLVKHYFERLKKDHSVGKGLTQLRKDELLYDQAFNVVKVRIIPPYVELLILIPQSELPCRSLTVCHYISPTQKLCKFK